MIFFLILFFFVTSSRFLKMIFQNKNESHIFSGKYIIVKNMGYIVSPSLPLYHIIA